MVSPLSWFIKRQRDHISLITTNISEASYSYRYGDEVYQVTNETIRRRESPQGNGYCIYHIYLRGERRAVRATTSLEALKIHLGIKD